ncbi:hypothetical protein PR202_gb08273 [Eleusine coracana subsp. coracana]|uniref:Uncharacterized protein n=1 Tax=Eleusine coracana subsp. coracana TaxID=191504 RepID=A0AAV5EE81_ELECO|nr:hypothetical protein PR202_gb08273 [Eleusine coracana subsp. coracana]
MLIPARRLNRPTTDRRRDPEDPLVGCSHPPRLLLSSNRLRADPNRRRPYAPRLAAPRNRIGAPAYGRRSQDGARHRTVQRPSAGWIGPSPTKRASSLPACLFCAAAAAEWLARWRCGLWSWSFAWSGAREDARKTTEQRAGVLPRLLEEEENEKKPPASRLLCRSTLLPLVWWR